MKLQLTATQAELYSAKVGAKTTIANDSKQIIALFAQEGHDPFTRRDVTKVLETLGHSVDGDAIDPDTNEKKKNTIGDACGAHEKSGRGYYTQGDSVGRAAPVTTSNVDQVDGLEILSKSGISMTPVAVPSKEKLEGYYTNDPGLRRLAVAQSKCFGAYMKKAAPCKECPLARWCAQASQATLADLAAKLDKETDDALIAAAKAVRQARAPAPTLEEPTAAQMAQAPQAPATAGEVDLSGMPEGTQAVELPFEGVCSKCDKTLPKGSTAYHVPGTGMLHAECL